MKPKIINLEENLYEIQYPTGAWYTVATQFDPYFIVNGAGRDVKPSGVIHKHATKVIKEHLAKVQEENKVARD